MKRFVIVLTALTAAILGVYFASFFSASGEYVPLAELDTRKSAIDLAEVQDARHEFASVLETLQSAHDLPGSDEELTQVLRSQARVLWKVFENFDDARQLLDLAESVDVDLAESALERVRLELTARDLDAAADAARRARLTALTQGERYDATLAATEVAVASAVQACLNNEPYDRESIRLAKDSLQALVEELGSAPSVARLRLRASLLVGDGESALKSIHAWYSLSNDSEPPAAISSGIASLRKLLPRSREFPSLEARVDVAVALSESRLFEEAVIFVKSSPFEIREKLEQRPEIREIIAYYNFCDSVRKTTLDHYRRAATSESTESADWHKIHEAMQDLWADLVDPIRPLPPRDKSSSYASAIERELGPRFGTVIRFVDIDGYQGIQMGHVVSNETRTVHQYGKSATVRFVVLDSVISNGFASWAWNSGAQHGGWTESDLIVQVRPPYASKPFRVWRTLTWPDESIQRRQEIDKETAIDLDRARENPRGYLPGLAMRVHDQGALQLLQGLRDEGIEDPDLRVAFVAAYAKTIRESSIFAHEGRHLIDRIGRLLPVPSWRKEYHAKLSEVAFAPTPRLAFGAIFASNIGDRGAHGRANAKIVSGLVDWMERNQSSIRAFRPDLPTLPQFDKLTDEQIHEAVRSLDPLEK